MTFKIVFNTINTIYLTQIKLYNNNNIISLIKLLIEPMEPIIYFNKLLYPTFLNTQYITHYTQTNPVSIKKKTLSPSSWVKYYKIKYLLMCNRLFVIFTI